MMIVDVSGTVMTFKNPSGTTIELTTGVNTPVPMGSAVTAPQSSPAPICFDHAIVRAVDVNQAYDFAALTMGLKESGRIVAPDGIPVLGFFRSHTLYHCYGVARSPHDGLSASNRVCWITYGYWELATRDSCGKLVGCHQKFRKLRLRDSASSR